MDGRSSPLEAPPRLARIKERRDFLAAARAGSAAAPGFVLQARRRSQRDAERLCGKGLDPAAPRLGFTASKKVGNAVARNRAKRRLRAVSDEIAPGLARDGWDYVLIARAGETATRSFALMRAELAQAFARAHDAASKSGGAKGGGRGTGRRRRG